MAKARHTICILRQSSERMAITVPLIRNALGSPDGLLPIHSTRVPGISPISRSRRLISPQGSSCFTFAVFPSGRSLRFFTVYSPKAF